MSGDFFCLSAIKERADRQKREKSCGRAQIMSRQGIRVRKGNPTTAQMRAVYVSLAPPCQKAGQQTQVASRRRGMQWVHERSGANLRRPSDHLVERTAHD